MPREERKRSLDSSGEEKAKKPLSRLGQMEKDGITPNLPPLPVPQMATWLMQIGPTEPAGMAAGPISWTTLRAWQDVAGVPLSPWAANTLRKMSVDYLVMADDAKAIDCPSPWAVELNERNREAVSSKISAIFGSRARGD